MSIISSSCGQDYVNAMNQILTSIDGGIDNFETMYHIQPYMYDYNEIEWAREKLKEEYLIKLLDQLSSFANNIPNYQDVYDQVSYYVFKSI